MRILPHDETTTPPSACDGNCRRVFARLLEDLGAERAENKVLRQLAESRGDDAATMKLMLSQALGHVRTLQTDLAKVEAKYRRVLDAHRDNARLVEEIERFTNENAALRAELLICLTRAA